MGNRIGMRQLAIFGLLLFFIVAMQSCKVYSFTGANIPEDIKTFNVELFQNRANNGPASLPQSITDQLKLKFQTEANLRSVSGESDIQFKGTITGFTYTNEAAVAGATSGLNKLTLTIQIECINNRNEKDNFTETFSRYAQFPASQDIPSVEDQLIGEINRQLVDDVFQRAFVKW